MFDELNKVVVRSKRVIKEQQIKLMNMDKEFWEQDRAHYIEKEQLQQKILMLERRLNYSPEAVFFAHMANSNISEDGLSQNGAELSFQQRCSTVVGKLSKVLVELVLSRAKIAAVSNNWKAMETHCQHALKLATVLDYEPLTAYCEYNRSIALYGQRKHGYALEVFSKSSPCIDVYATSQMWDAWMEKMRQKFQENPISPHYGLFAKSRNIAGGSSADIPHFVPEIPGGAFGNPDFNARLPTPESSQAHTAEEHQTDSNQTPLKPMRHPSRNSVSHSETTNQTPESINRSESYSKLKSSTVLADELAGLGYFEDDVSLTLGCSDGGAPWESHSTLFESHDHSSRHSHHPGAPLKNDSYASLMNASSTETPVHWLGTFTRFYKGFISSGTDKSPGPPALATPSNSSLAAENRRPASPKNPFSLDRVSQNSGPTLSTQLSGSAPSTCPQRPQIGVNTHSDPDRDSLSIVGKAIISSEKPSTTNDAYSQPRHPIPLTAEALLQLGKELRTSYATRSTAAASMLESRVVRSAGTPSVGAWNEDMDSEAEIRDGVRRTVSEYGGLNRDSSFIVRQWREDMRCEVSSIESSEDEIADVGHNVEGAPRGFIGKVAGAVGNFLVKPFQRRELVIEEDL